MSGKNSRAIDSVVILNMHYTGLGIARDLKDCAVKVYGLSFDEDFIGNVSRHCQFLRYPNPEVDSRACLKFLLDLSNNLGSRALLLATRDQDLDFIQGNRKDLEEAFLLPWPDNHALEVILRKSLLVDVARQNQVHCPDTVLLKQVTDLHALEERIQFPCIVKPDKATDWRSPAIWKSVGKRKVIMCNSLGEIEYLARKLLTSGTPILVQEYVSGSDDNLVMFCSYRSRQGVIEYFTSRKLLQNPPHSGTGIAVRSCVIPEIVEPSIRLLTALGYEGISEIEYKYDATKKDYALVEINPRHWDQHRLGTVSGVNLTLAQYSDLSGQRVPSQHQTFERTWIAEDAFIRSVIDRLRSRRSGYSWKRYWDALTGRPHFAVLDRRDYRPFLRLIRLLWRSLVEGLRRS